MIRIRKSNLIPESLQKEGCTEYNREDVKKQLLADQYEKCYICERKLITDCQIEHFKSQKEYPHLKTEWTNLLLSCNYCNGKKSNKYDGLLNPIENPIEEFIEHIDDFPRKKVLFRSKRDDVETINTIKLLSVIFNGTGISRKILEERFYEYYLSRLNSFKKLVDLFLTNPTEDYRKAIIERLQIDREFLGFKYRIIKNYPTLEHEFGEYINWNNINKYNNNL